MSSGRGLKVLMLSWEYPPRIVGGLSRHVYWLSRSLASRGVDVTVMTLDYPGLPRLDVRENLRIIRVQSHGYPSPDFPAWVHRFNLGMVETALHEGGDYSLIHAHDWLVASAGIALKHTLRVPLVATVHSTERGRRSGIHDQLQVHIHEMEWWLTYESWRVIACSEHMRGEVMSYLGVPHDKVDVIPNGVSPSSSGAPIDYWSVRRRYAADGEKLVLFVGRMVYEKGVHVLIDAALNVLARRSDVKFVLAGEGPMRRELMDRVAAAGRSDRFYFLGFVPDPELQGLYRVADLAVFPSIYEPFGIVALEAMSMAKPLVVSDVGGLGEVVEDGRTGVKVPCCDSASLARAIERVLDDPRASEMGREGARVARERYSWDRLAGETLKVYERVLDEYSRSGWRPRRCTSAPGQ